MASIAGKIEVSRNNLEDYFMFMEKAGMIARLRQSGSSINLLGKVEKVYLDNPNILMNLGNENSDRGTVRETFFFNQMRVNHLVTASPVSDFEIEGTTFEVGGKSKGSDQVRNAEKGYVVKDDIEHGFANIVPLWAFGLNY